MLKANVGLLLAGACAFGLVAPAAAQNARPLPAGITLRAEVEPRVMVGDYVRYRIVLEGNVEVQTSTMPDFSNVPVTVVSGPSQQFRMVNSRVSQSWEFTLSADKIGTVTLPPAQMRINGYDYETNSVKVEVTPLPEEYRGLENVMFARSANPDLNRLLRGNLFGFAEVPEVIYEGQAVPVTVYAYRDVARTDLTFNQFDMARAPQSSDFLMPQVNQRGNKERSWETAMMDDRRFQRVPLYTFFAVPTKSGKLRLTPPLLRVHFPLSQRGGRARSIDDLFGSFGSTRHEAAELPIPSMQLDVKPLPPKPDDAIAQIVGEVTITASADRRELARRELLTIRLEILGEAYLETMSAPRFEPPRHLVPIDSKAEYQSIADGSTLVSKRIYEYTFQAVGEGKSEIPALRFAIFNPRTAQTQMTETTAIALNITPATGETLVVAGAGDATALDAVPARATARELGRDVAYIDTRPLTEDGGVRRRAFYTEPWFYAAQSVPLLASLCFGGLALRRRLAPAETRTQRIRRARKDAHAAIRQAQELAQGGDAGAFYGALSRAALTYVAAMLDRAASGITLDELEAGLLAAGQPADKTEALLRLLRKFDSVRFSPIADDAASRKDYIARLEAALEGMDTP